MAREYTSKFNKPAYVDLGKEQNLEPLFDDQQPPSIELWHETRKDLIAQWESVLGHPSFTDFNREEELVEVFEHLEFRGRLYRQPTGPDTKQLVLLMEPLHESAEPRPGAIVPFYHPDASAGYDLKHHKQIEEKKNTQFGLHLVRQGYVVVCTEAFPFNTVPEPPNNTGMAWWQAAADQLKHDHPHWTGMGKLIWDTKCAVDLLFKQNKVDKERIVVMGHSLGGKMAFCTAAFDDRVKAVVASDFGMGWDFTNWDDDWYYGRQIHDQGFCLANHQLLALIAPRPFLLIGGQYDKPESWQYINAAKRVFNLYSQESPLGFLDHASGHYPPEDAIDSAYKWLAEQFNH